MFSSVFFNGIVAAVAVYVVGYTIGVVRAASAVSISAAISVPVNQEPQLYALTVRENMTMYHSADNEALHNALRQAGLSIGLDSEVTREFSDSGIMLSGGQAQKLGLTRLLHGEFGLLLLDEPSSALDPLAEYEMTRLIFEQAATTTIMVAHRLSTIRDADRIYLISNGGIAESGTHDELMATGGTYAEMFTKQAEKYVR